MTKIVVRLKTPTRLTIVINLTLAEARAMSWALGNSTNHPDAMESLFPTLHGRKAAWRAHAKIDEAVRYADETKPKRRKNP